MNHTKYLVFTVLFGVLLYLNSSVSADKLAVWMRGYDSAASGVNLVETTLNTANVNAAQFGKISQRTVTGQIIAQVLYVPNLSINGGVRDVFFVATMANYIYAFDANDMNPNSAPLWSRKYGEPVPIVGGRLGAICDNYVNIMRQAGIQSTPAIHMPTLTMYFVTANQDSANVENYRIRAIDITTGIEKYPAAIVSGSVNAVGGIVDTFNPRAQKQRVSLNILNGVVYFAFGSYCEQRNPDPYSGWVFGYDLQLNRKFVYSDTPTGNGGGVWQSGSPITHDGSNLFVVTANGAFDVSAGAKNFGSSVLKLDPNSVVASGPYKDSCNEPADFFSPYNSAGLSAANVDLGSTYAKLIPNTNRIFLIGKEGTAYLLNKDNMGKWNAGSDNILQRFPGSVGHASFGPMVMYDSPTKGLMIFCWSSNDYLRVFYYNKATGTIDLSKNEVGSLQAPFPGASLMITANGQAAGSAILWAYTQTAGSFTAVEPALLRAFDVHNINVVLYSTATNSARDNPTYYSRLSAVMCTDGKVFVPSWRPLAQGDQHVVTIYGLLNGQPPAPTPSPTCPGNCNGHGTCTAQNVCTCTAGYNPATYCSTCRANYDNSSGCTACVGNWEITTQCATCKTGWTGADCNTATTPGSTVVRINVGGPQLTLAGKTWAADQTVDAVKGTLRTTTAVVTGTTMPELHTTYRFKETAGSMQFTIPVNTDGTYSVSLYFAETYAPFVVGSRVFDIALNGVVVHANTDIFNEAGGLNKSLVKTAQVTSVNKQIVIALNRKVENPRLDAIEVIQV